MIFSVYVYKCCKYGITLHQKKIKNYLLRKKIHLKVTDMLNHILEKVPTVLCNFMETIKGFFIYCFPVKKKKKQQKNRKLNI